MHAARCGCVNLKDIYYIILADPSLPVINENFKKIVIILLPSLINIQHKNNRSIQTSSL